MASIKPDKILKQLEDIWVSFAHPSEDPEAQSDGVLRACSMTLMSFVDDEEDAVALGEILSSLMREHPSRMVVVRLKEGEDFLDARVFAQCWMPFGHRRQICCEQIEIVATMDRLADVAAIVGPLAVPDLPRMILLRSARIVRAGALRKILPLGDKIIVDSTASGAPGFGELGGLLESRHVVGDLAWTRITDVRSLLAQVLADETPSSITIEYCGREAGPEARYLEAWLGSSLPAARVGLKGTGAPGAGNPTSIRVGSELSMTLCEGGAEVRIGELSQRASFSHSTIEELLNAELSIVVHDPVFERALNRITA
jgi:glucose-6-phosphate dehydrogenase assembly protein OpcA